MLHQLTHVGTNVLTSANKKYVKLEHIFFNIYVQVYTYIYIYVISNVAAVTPCPKLALAGTMLLFVKGKPPSVRIRWRGTKNNSKYQKSPERRRRLLAVKIAIF